MKSFIACRHYRNTCHNVSLNADKKDKNYRISDVKNSPLKSTLPYCIYLPSNKSMPITSVIANNEILGIYDYSYFPLNEFYDNSWLSDIYIYPSDVWWTKSA